MTDVFDFLQKPVAVSWPGKRVAVIEISTSTSRDDCPPVILQSAPATANSYNLNSSAEVIDPSGKIVNPMTPKMRAEVNEWSHGATVTATSSEGGAGARNVFFINLDHVRSKMSKGQNDYKFTINTPGNTNGTSIHGALTAVKWFLTWQSRGPDPTSGAPCGGPPTGTLSRFGFLPGNGFAPLVYQLGHVVTPGDVLANAQIISDSSAIQGAQEAEIVGEDPCAFNFNFTTNVDFMVQTVFTVDDILFFDIRVSTYQLTGANQDIGLAPYDAGTELDFPVSAGSPGWDVEATASGLGRIQLFGDSGGLTTLQAKKLTFTVRFPDLEVGARIN